MTIALPTPHSGLRPEAVTRVPVMPAARSAINPLVRAMFYVFVFSIPFEMPHRSIPLEIPTLTGLLFLGSTLLAPRACYRRIPGPIIWFAAYLWVFVLSTVLGAQDHPAMVTRFFLEMIQLVLIFWAGTSLLADPQIRRTALLALAIGGAIRAGIQVFGVAATAHTVWTGGERVTAFGQNANLSAMILSAALIATVGLRLGIVAGPLGAAIGFAIIQTGSRGGLLCALVGMGVFLVQGSGRSPWIRVRNALMGLIGVSVLAWGALQSDVMRNRIDQTADEGNLAGRERIYPTEIGMIGERPFVGWGPIENQFELERRLDERGKIRRDAHNIVLELLTSTGVIGAVPFLIGLGLCVLGAWRGRRGPDGILPFAVLGAVLVGTMSGTWIASKILWFAMAQGFAACAD